MELVKDFRFLMISGELGRFDFGVDEKHKREGIKNHWCSLVSIWRPSYARPDLCYALRSPILFGVNSLPDTGDV